MRNKMFDRLIREVKRMEKGISVSLDIAVDDEGYLDRQCSAEQCHAEFKVLFEDWRDKVSDEVVYCPVCRFEQPSTEWNTPEQSEYLKAAAASHAQRIINNALKEDTKRFNRQKQSGFIHLSMFYKPGRPVVAIPADAAEVMRQQ